MARACEEVCSAFLLCGRGSWEGEVGYSTEGSRAFGGLGAPHNLISSSVHDMVPGGIESSRA